MDPSSYSSFPEWSHLPNEIKTTVIREMDNNSRLALRACSSDCQKLVDSIPYRTICQLTLFSDENMWYIIILRSVYSNVTTFKFPSFDEFQTQLTKVIERSDFIHEIKTSDEDIKNNISLLKFGKLLKIGKLYFYGNLHNISEQIDLSQIKKLTLTPKDAHSEALPMSKITFKEILIFDDNNIRDDQLLTFEGCELFLNGCKMLTSCGINKYIRRCLTNLDKTHVVFRIWYDEENNTASKVIEGLDIASNATLNEDVTKSRTQKNFNVLELLKAEFHEKESILTVVRKDKGRVHYKFESTDDLKLKLTEEIVKTNYIKHMEILGAPLDWNLTFPISSKITVGKLAINEGKHGFEFLQQIEPYHLKDMKFHVHNNNEKLCDMPQVIHAEKLNLFRCCIRDDQLLRLKAYNLEINTGAFGKRSKLTDSGINAYVKKCLLELNQHNFRFYFQDPVNERNVSKLCEGLDIFSEKRIDQFRKQRIVNSPFPEYQLELTFERRALTGRRIEKS